MPFLPHHVSKPVAIVFCALTIAGCATHRVPALAPPAIIAHSEWEEQPPLGYAADASRRNLRAGDSLRFRDLTITVVSMENDTVSRPASVDLVRLRLSQRDTADEHTVREGAAFNWNGFHLAVLAIYGPGELGGGLAVIEVGTVASLPPHVANSDSAGGASLRLRVPHRITHVTLHHTGSAEPLRPEDDPADKLRGLQSWVLGIAIGGTSRTTS